METEVFLSNSGNCNLIVLVNNEIRTFPLDTKARWTLGRTTPISSPDIPIESAIVGKEHGELFCVDQEWYYVDKGSINGTYFNGKNLSIGNHERSKAQLLKNGDILRIDSSDLGRPDERGVWMLFSTGQIGDNWQHYSLDKKEEIIIGRDQENCNIVLDMPYISAKHACIGYVASRGHYFIMDCGSLAGTWVNEERLLQGRILNEKDHIAICDTSFVFVGDELIYNADNSQKEKKEAFGNAINAPITESGAGNLGVMPNESRRIVLKADIKSKKVPNNSGIGEKEIIRDVQVEVKEGSLVALLGGSGAGKTTVMNCLNGMDTMGVQGSVEYKGVDLLRNFERMKCLIGSVPQGEVFHEELVLEKELKTAATIRLPKDTTRKEIKEHVDKAIAQLKLENVRKNRIKTCSGGEKKRVNIAIELVADRQMLCLDEPDAGLDPGIKTELFSILRQLAHEEGKTILVIIHDVSDIDLFDQIIMMTKLDNIGRLAFSGSPEAARKYFKVENIKEAYGLLAENPEKYIGGQR